MAVEIGDAACVQVLLGAGTDVHVTDKVRTVPLKLSLCECSSLSLVYFHRAGRRCCTRLRRWRTWVSCRASWRLASTRTCWNR